VPRELPVWLKHVRGEAPVLVVAPHGGRRPAASELEPGKSRKVNDLHTVEIALDLAERTRASAIVNSAEDRNRVDLNRVSDVRRDAPWLLDLLLEEVRAALATADCATLLFVHGWNAIQPCCDVGIGARLDEQGFVAVKQGVPTIAIERLPRISRFAERCRSGGIAVTIGDRYPAAGRDNLMQIFTRRYADDQDARIRALAELGAAGKIFAVQLELAVPLRWPGPLRERVIEAAAELAADPPEAPADIRRTIAAPSPPPPADQIAIEFHDGPSGVGGFAAIERMISGRRHGRFLVCIGGRRLALFTGEDGGPCDEPLRCVGLEWRRSESGEVSLDFAGPCLTFPRTDPFLDLEAGLFDASLSRLEVHLLWKPLVAAAKGFRGGARLGHVEGRVRHDDWSSSISAPAALQDGAPARETVPWQERRTLRIPLGEDGYVSISSRTGEHERIEGEIVRGGQSEPILSGGISVHNSADGLVPEAWRIEAVSRTARLRVFGHVTHAIPVVRPAAEGKIFTLFGLARFTSDDRVGYGTFEQSERVSPKGRGR